MYSSCVLYAHYIALSCHLLELYVLNYGFHSSTVALCKIEVPLNFLEKVNKILIIISKCSKTLLKVILRGFFQEIVDESDVGFPVDSEDEGIDSGEDDKGDGKQDKDEDDEDEDEDDEDEVKEREKKKKFVRKEKPKLKVCYIFCFSPEDVS